MAWTDIPDTDVDQDSPVTVALMTALRDNPIAISDSDPGAPINETGWHPYNRSVNGGNGDGILWDAATDGGVGSIETPDLEDGYQYALFFSRIGCSASTFQFQVRVRRSTDDAYLTYHNVSGALNFTFVTGGAIYFDDATLDSFTHTGDARILSSSAGVGGSNITSFRALWTSSVSYRINRIQIRVTAGTFSIGTMFLMRRRWEQPV